jgi:transcriptional regulator with XRE-family HTH domain
MATQDEKSTGFGERLKQLRMQKGLSQVDLAKLANVNSNHISRYERGDSRPTAKYLKILADCLGVSTDYLYDGVAEDAAIADFEDREFLEIFKEAEQLEDEDKVIIKRLLKAFLNDTRLKKQYAS